MEKGKIFGLVKKNTLAVVTAAVLFSGCNEKTSENKNIFEKKSEKKLEKKLEKKSEFKLKNNLELDTVNYLGSDLELSVSFDENSDSENNISENNNSENNISEYQDIFLSKTSDILDNSNISSDSNILNNFEKINDKTEELSEDFLLKKEIEKKEKEEFLILKKSLDKKFNWTLWKLLSNKAKISHLDKIKSGDEDIFFDLEGKDLEYFNKLNFFREKILSGEKKSDVKKNIISELNFEYEELKSLSFNGDKIFTEARKIISGEVSMEDSFLNSCKDFVQKKEEKLRILNGEDFSEKYFNKNKIRLLRKFSQEQDFNFLNNLNSNINSIINSENRYKNLINFRNEGGLFFEINPS